MPSEQKDPLLERLEHLKGAAAASEAKGNPRLDEAIDSLNQLAGRPRAKEGSAFEDIVWHALTTIPGAVVARNPHTAATTFEPDFLVTLGEHTFLVEAKDPSADLPGVAQRLAGAVDAYGADEAVLVLPEEDAQPGVDLAEDRLQLLALSGLRSFFTQ